MFADNTYSKPYFVTYVNSSFFCIPLIPIALYAFYKNPGELKKLRNIIPSRIRGYSKVPTTDVQDEEDTTKPVERHGLLHSNSSSSTMSLEDDAMGSQMLDLIPEKEGKLGLAETARLSVEFSFLWFAANYFVSACLEYTTVSSATILTSTSSIWTLLIGTIWGVEHFTLKKLGGVLVSLAGIILISSVDMSGETDKNRGSFPHKTMKEIAVGDAMAFFSAVLYGLYAVVMKKRIGDESRVDMPVFFGLVGIFNVLIMWPGFLILHFTGIEEFQLPPSSRVITIIIASLPPTISVQS
jgi:solute carrier family 35 protein F5